MSRRPTISLWRNAGKVAETSRTGDDVVRETGWVFNNATGEDLTLEQFVATGWPEITYFFGKLGLFWKERRSKSVVEIGSGIGRMTASLTKEFSEVVACDLDAAFLERCRETVAQFGNVAKLKTVHVEDGHTLQIPDASADIVFSYITLQHCKRDDALGLVRESLRVVKPGGKVALNFRTWTPQDAVLVPAGAVVRAIWRMFPKLARAPRLVTRFGWQANRVAPKDVIDVVRSAAPDAAKIEVFRPERRASLASPIPAQPMSGLHKSHWWLVVTR